MSPPTYLPRILIVDDQPDNVGLLGAALSADYVVQFSFSGTDALERMAQHVPDLVLLDVMMPGVDGFETLRRLRAAPWGRTLAVILVTADTSNDTHVVGLDLGADDFITKPIIIPVLRARIRNVLERHTLLAAQERLVVQLEASNRELARLAELNTAIFQSAGEGIYSTTPDGICNSINPAALDMLGYAAEEILGHHQHQVFHHHHADGSPYPAEDCPIFQTLHDGQKRMGEDCFICKDGSLLPVQLTVTPLRIEDCIVGVEVLFQDISERQRTQQELLRLATTDELTGVVNRRHFFELGESERARVVRYASPTGLLMLDIDHFKDVNDLFGHAGGDAVLRSFTACITRLLRSVDIFGRLGGEEFSVLLPETDLEGALAFAERLRASIEQHDCPWGRERITVTTSIGVTTLTAADQSLDVALIRADCALYEAKARGRNCVHVQPGT